MEDATLLSAAPLSTRGDPNTLLCIFGLAVLILIFHIKPILTQTPNPYVLKLVTLSVLGVSHSRSKIGW